MSPGRWLELRVRIPSEELTVELAEGLLALGGSAVEEDGDTLGTYVGAPADAQAFLAEAARRLEAILGSAPRLEWHWRADEDWSASWKRGLEPRRVSSRVTVTQPWNPVDERRGGVVVVIDPSSAFGTGEHATTRGALRLLDHTLRADDRVLDVGSGSGVLAIAAALLGAGRVVALEMDPDAVAVAGENLERNGVTGAVELVCRRVDSEYLDGLAETFQIVLANILSGVLTPMLGALAARASADGRVILGGILDTEADEVVAAASAAGLRLDREDREAEWWTGLFARAGSPRR